MLYASVSLRNLLGDEASVLGESCGVTHVLSAVSKQRLKNLIDFMEDTNVRPKHALSSLSQKLMSLP